MELLRKVTIKNTGWTVAKIKAAFAPITETKTLEGKPVEVVVRPALDNGASVPLVKVFGIANRAQPGQSDNGSFLKLMGEFTAQNLQTQMLYHSGVCIMPTFISEVFAGVMQASGGRVEFALQIDATRDDDAATGYTFTVRTLTPPKSSDRMAELMALGGVDALPALPAPASDAPPAPARSGKRK